MLKTKQKTKDQFLIAILVFLPLTLLPEWDSMDTRFILRTNQTHTSCLPEYVLTHTNTHAPPTTV